MRTDRRGFLRVAGGAAALLLVRPASAAAPGALEVHRATRNTRMGAIGAALAGIRRPPRPAKAYRGLRRIPLPKTEGVSRPLAEVVRGYARPPSLGGGRLELAGLARLLRLANGPTGTLGETRLRAAPSAGALYAGEVYVVARRVEGLDPGVYSYAVLEDALIAIGEAPTDAALLGAFEQPEQLAGAPALVLLTNVFGRYTWRYRNRGYRYALIDSGHIGENLRLASREAGLAELAPLRFHDQRLNALTDVDGRGEAVCAVHAIGTAAEAPSGQGPARHFAESGFASGSARVIDRFHQATMLVEAQGLEPETREADASAPLSRRPDPAENAQSPETSVSATILQRRSAKGFRREPITRAQLGFVLEMARGHSELERAPGVELALLVHRVEGLVPGHYVYRPEARALGIVREGDLGASFRGACLDQEMAATASVGLLMMGRIEREAARTGARSYRDLLLESGAVGQRVYLAAEALGLAARNLAAFLDDELNALLGLDGGDTAIVHLTMLGHEL